MADDTPAPAEIEKNLAQTRDRIDQRLGAIQEKLAPRQLVNDGLAYLQGEDGADFTRALVRKIRSNPVPVLLIGGGLAWLLASQDQRPGSASSPGDVHSRIRDAEKGVVRYSGEDDATFGERLADARGKAMGLARDAGDTASSYAQKVSDAITQAGYAGGSSPRAKLQSARSTLSGPLGLGAVAAVAGAILGSLLPSTQYEEEKLGASAARVRQAGSDAAQALVDSGSRIAGEALNAAQESASNKGLGSDKPIGETFADLRSGDLVGDVREVLHEGLEGGKTALHDELHSGDR
jgi:hypothetical protein